MPNETREAIKWALFQKVDDIQVQKNTCHLLVDKVAEYFSLNNIEHKTFSYRDLEQYFQ
jgi:hypothetical protein